jgi:putative thioredoxin
MDVTDATFETDVVERSKQAAVVVDLWAPWCGPCRTLGPILEKVIAETDGKVVLAKVNVDENPAVSQAFRVQGIPAVYALVDGKVVDGFVGALGESAVREFVGKLAPSEIEEAIRAHLEAGDRDALEAALELDPTHEAATLALAEVLVQAGEADEALRLLEKVVPSAEAQRIAALARVGDEVNGDDEIIARLDTLLGQVKGDDERRQEFLDLLNVLGPSDPRTLEYRRKLTSALY